MVLFSGCRCALGLKFDNLRHKCSWIKPEHATDLNCGDMSGRFPIPDCPSADPKHFGRVLYINESSNGVIRGVFHDVVD